MWAGGEVVYVIGGAGAVLRSRDRGETFERVLGMAGILDTARFRTFVAWETGSSLKDGSR